MFIFAVFIKYNQKTYDARLRLATNTILRILACATAILASTSSATSTNS